MCFYNDYEWYAAIQTDETRTAEKQLACGECGCKIEVGQQYRYIFQQEHEQCDRCFGYLEQKDQCECDEPDLGEQFCICICLECDKFMEAIKAAEVEEGCDGDETQPALGRLFEQIAEVDDVDRYFVKARELFPELEASGYLSRNAVVRGEE
jgi:hypothetical protein